MADPQLYEPKCLSRNRSEEVVCDKKIICQNCNTKEGLLGSLMVWIAPSSCRFLSAFTIIFIFITTKSWLPCTSLVNLASASNPTFLSLSGNLNIHAAWTECSLASWLQLVCPLAGWQLLHCSALMSQSPKQSPSHRKLQLHPPELWNRCSYYWVLEAGNSSSETSDLYITAVAPLTGDMHLTWEQMRQTHFCLFSYFAVC